MEWNCGTPTVNKQGCFGCGVCTRQAEEFPINILEFFYHLPLTFTDCLIIKLKQTLIKYVYSAFTYKWHKECVQYKQITSIISHQSIKWLTLCSCCLLNPQNSQQKSVPNLYVVTVAFLALKKLVFSLFRTQKKNFKIFFIKLLCNFSVRTL